MSAGDLIKAALVVAILFLLAGMAIIEPLDPNSPRKIAAEAVK